VPKRSSVRDRLDQDQARGQEAIYGEPETPAPEPVDHRSTAAAVPRRSPGEAAAAASWEASHQRVTFYCPLELLEAIEADMRRSGRSKTAVIVDALREHLNVRGNP
jgi:Ribbon-helix-helix protein, copG family